MACFHSFKSFGLLVYWVSGIGQVMTILDDEGFKGLFAASKGGQSEENSRFQGVVFRCF